MKSTEKALAFDRLVRTLGPPVVVASLEQDLTWFLQELSESEWADQEAEEVITALTTSKALILVLRYYTLESYSKQKKMLKKLKKSYNNYLTNNIKDK